MPSITPPIPVSSTVRLELGPVAGERMNSQEKEFLEEVLMDSLNVMLEDSTPKITLIQVNVVAQEVGMGSSRNRQLRRLQGSNLFAVVQMKGEYTPSKDWDYDVDFDKMVKDHFNKEETIKQLEEDLKNGSDDDNVKDYFKNVSTVGLEKDDIGGGGGGGGGGEDPMDDEKTDDNNNIIIIASAASGGAVLLFAVALYVYRRNSRYAMNMNIMKAYCSKQFSSSTINLSLELHSSSDTDENQQLNAGNRFPIQTQPDPKPEPQSQPQPQPPQHQHQQDWEDFQPLSPDNETEDGRSRQTFDTLDKLYAGDNDNVSHGYSLEDGLASTVDNDTVKGDRARAAGSVYSGVTFDDGTQKKYGTASGRNKTSMPSEIENLVDDGVVKEYIAPPGKLGVVIDSSEHGPVVFQVKAGSPLENMVFPGDRIVAIDEIDTRRLTASNVTKIMARKCDEERVIKVFSKN